MSRYMQEVRSNECLALLGLYLSGKVMQKNGAVS